MTMRCVFWSCDVRPPELELKNAKGLSYDKLEELRAELERLAERRCGEVRNPCLDSSGTPYVDLSDVSLLATSSGDDL